MTLNRRSVLFGLTGTAIGLSGAFGAAALSSKASENSMSYAEINVQQAIEISDQKIILHCGDNFDQTHLRSLKNAIEHFGHSVEIYHGGPDNMIASYAYGHNFPGQHYSAQNSNELVLELQKLAQLNNMALGHNAAP